jgi:hypothetical protein
VRAAFLVLAACAAGDRPDPTATLTANDQTSLTSHTGDPITYAWSSTNADSGSSTAMMTTGSDGCGNHDGPWIIDTTAGSDGPEAILACQVGTTYTLSFVATQDDSGLTATATVTIVVE